MIATVLLGNLLNYNIAQTQTASNGMLLAPTEIVNYNVILDEDYEIAENETVLIANCTFTVHGSIRVYGNLVTRNATIQVIFHNYPQWINLRGTANLKGYNTTLKGHVYAHQNSMMDLCNLSLEGSLIGYDHSRVNLNEVKGINRIYNWVGFHASAYGNISNLNSDLVEVVYLVGSSRADINKSTLSKLQLQENTKASIVNSEVDVLEIRPTITTDFPYRIEALPNSTVNVDHSRIKLLKICGSSRVFLWSSIIEQVETPPKYYEGNPFIVDNTPKSSLWLIVTIFIIGAVVITSFLLLRRYAHRYSHNNIYNQHSNAFP